MKLPHAWEVGSGLALEWPGAAAAGGGARGAEAFTIEKVFYATDSGGPTASSSHMRYSFLLGKVPHGKDGASPVPSSHALLAVRFRAKGQTPSTPPRIYCSTESHAVEGRNSDPSGGKSLPSLAYEDEGASRTPL